MKQRGHWGGVGTAVVLACLVCAHPARAAEEIIDGFTAAVNTAYPIQRNVLGSTVEIDQNLATVIGGVRQLTVSATVLTAPGADNIVAGVAPMSALLNSNTSAGAAGAVDVLYDRNGSGLNAFLEFAMGIEVQIAMADLTAVMPPGLNVTVTLADASLTPVSVTQTVLMPVMSPSLPLDFPFSSFAGIDPASLFSIEISYNLQQAADVRLAGIQTFGTPTNETICDDGIDNNNNGFTDCADRDCVAFPGCPATQAPVLSPGGSAIAFVSMVAIALVALRRRRQTLR